MNNKFRNELNNGLFSENEAVVIKLLEKISNKGDASIIEILAQALLHHKNENIKQEIRNTFVNIKSKNVVKYIIKIIQKKSFFPEKGFFVSICWQIPFSFVEYFDFFAKIFLNDEFSIAFEAYTVLESTIDSDGEFFTKDFIAEKVDYFKSNLKKSDEQRRLLSMELIHQLEAL